MIQIKDYYCESTPTYDELVQAKHCIVHLKWFVEYSGWYDRYI